MNIVEFRKKYPDYNDMSDKELSDRIYSKHYSDMPRGEFDLAFLGKGGSASTQPIAQTPQVNSTQTPEWAGRYPNLYGVAGAARETLGPILEAAGLAGGGVLGTAAGGPGGGVVGAGLGYGGIKQGLSSVDALLGNPPNTSPSQAPQDIVEGSTMEATGPIVAKGVTAAVKGLGNLGKSILGATTGAGPGATAAAVKGGDSFVGAMRGNITKNEVVDNFKSALGQLKEARSSAYKTQLAQISQDMTPIAGTPFRNKVTELLYDYGVRSTPKGGLDFSRSTFNKTAQKDVSEIVDMMRNWGSKPNDNTPIMLDTLKRRLDDFYTDSNNANAFVAKLRGTVKDMIVKQVPAYDKMTRGYKEATDLIKTIEGDLLMGKGRTEDQTLRRLTSAMRENFEMRRDLVKILGDKTGSDLTGQLGGYAMSQSIPRGLVGKLYAGGVGTGAAFSGFNPAIVPLLAGSSPRAVGEFLNVYGKGVRELSSLNNAMGLTQIAPRMVSKGIMEDEQ